MSKVLKITAGAVVLILIVWGIIASSKKDVVSTEPIKLGVSTILSSDWAALGQNIVNASKLAVEEINARGGIDGRTVELVIEDAGLDSKAGLSAAQKLVNVDKVKYIIGGTSSNGTMAAAPVVNQGKAVYLTPVTGGSNVDNAGDYVFRTANSDLLAGRDLASAAFRLGYKNVATISEVTEYTLDIKKTFEASFKELGGMIASSEEFQPGTSDFRTIVAKVKASKPDATLVLSQTGTGGAKFIKQAREAGIVVPLFSDFTFITNGDAKGIVGSFEGAYFADPAYDANSATTIAFFKKYKDAYKADPLIPFHAASAYDSIMMIADAIDAVGDNSAKVQTWLSTKVQDRKGLMGTYSIDAKGNSDLGFVIKQVKGDKFVEVK
ncbi:MAG TPA: ABC transporter substrate-binding protein [Candidatus Paceibacterota bacterium]